jgi:SAM-dependent methyltransferase
VKQFFSIDPQTKILDLGVRDGQLLWWLLKRGYRNLEGIDCVRLNVLLCKKNGLNVHELDGHEVGNFFAPESQDLIFSFHMLEHCYDPKKVIEGCYSALRSNGGVQLEIPLENADRQSAHCYRFAEGELSSLLKSVGFEVLDYRHWDGKERVIAKKKTNSTGLVATFKKWFA